MCKYFFKTKKRFLNLKLRNRFVRIIQILMHRRQTVRLQL